MKEQLSILEHYGPDDERTLCEQIKPLVEPYKNIGLDVISRIVGAGYGIHGVIKFIKDYNGL